MFWFAQFRREARLRRLRRRKRQESAHFDRLLENAGRQKQSAEEIQEIHRQWHSADEHYSDLIATEDARTLIETAEDYGVPVYEFSPNSPWWEHVGNQQYRLNQAGRTNLNADIRREKDERWKTYSRLIPFISALTGLFGVIVAVIALLARRG